MLKQKGARRVSVKIVSAKNVVSFFTLIPRSFKRLYCTSPLVYLLLEHELGELLCTACGKLCVLGFVLWVLGGGPGRT